MYAINFEFDGERLSDYGMMICGMEGVSLNGTFSSGADLTFTQTSNVTGRHFYLFGSYNTPYQVTFAICKNICMVNSDIEDIHLSPILVSSIQRWLCRKTSYKKFKIIGDKNYADIFWNSTFTCQQIVSGGGIIGLSLTMYTDSPYGYRDEVVNKFNCKKDTPFQLIDMSDEIGYIQPNMKISFLESGKFSLTNSMDKRVFSINNCLNQETITIDGTHEIISTDSSFHNSTLYKDFNYLFVKIINTYDNRVNVYTPSLSCDIEISYTPIIKVGI